MSVWCMAHPWMTFFIAMSALQAPLIVIKTRGKRER